MSSESPTDLDMKDVGSRYIQIRGRNFLLGPTAVDFRCLLEYWYYNRDQHSDGVLKIVADPDIISTVFGSIETVLRVSELIDEESIELYELPSVSQRVLVCDDYGISIITESNVVLKTSDSNVNQVGWLLDFAVSQIESAEVVETPIPALNVIREEIEDQFDSKFRSHFSRAVENLTDDLIGDLSPGRAIVSVLVLLGAIYNVQLCELRKICEETDFGSSATLSRTKRRFEDGGVIETTKSQQDVGRPRQRLMVSESFSKDIEDPTVIGSLI